jgi:SET domain-containing protein
MPRICPFLARTHMHTRAPMFSMYRMKKTPQAASRPSSKPAVNGDARRIQVRRSGVHGKGVFALQPIAAGSRIIEYRGEIIGWPEALRRHPHDPADPNHTFYFSLDDGSHVIDAKVGGNAARWINHACEPNCEADETEGRVFIQALRDLQPGEELFYDYGLVIDERYTPKLKRDYECRCGSAICRGTMLAPKRRPAARAA